MVAYGVVRMCVCLRRLCVQGFFHVTFYLKIIFVTVLLFGRKLEILLKARSLDIFHFLTFQI